MEDSPLSIEEITYISACELLNGNLKLRFEMKHLHIDLLNSDSKYRMLSKACLESLIDLKITKQFDKANAIKILLNQKSHLPSLSLVGFVYELDGMKSEALSLYEKSKEYPPSCYKLLMLMYLEKNNPLINRDDKNKKMRGYLDDLERMGYIHRLNFIGVLYHDKDILIQPLDDKSCMEKAIQYYKEAVSHNCLMAYNNLGNLTKDKKGEYISLDEEERKILTFKYYYYAIQHENYVSYKPFISFFSDKNMYCVGWSERKRINFLSSLSQEIPKIGDNYSNTFSFPFQDKITYDDIVYSILKCGKHMDSIQSKFIFEEEYIICCHDKFYPDILWQMVKKALQTNSNFLLASISGLSFQVIKPELYEELLPKYNKKISKRYEITFQANLEDIGYTNPYLTYFVFTLK